ncbi:MAG: hypothetical protein CMO55_01560 [Verrucomicrobiales bacterium]|nr:hypothetical protein [Verrucomicrobiales bacterium]
MEDEEIEILESQENRSADEPSASPVRYVGIGASAGGLEALERFVERIPAESGCAFFVIQHLSPDYESRMDDLLGRKTGLKIKQAASELAAEPDTIYLLPPRREMIISDGRLLLREKDPNDGMSLPIDRFFKSLGDDVGECAVAVILSGTGSDGSRGLKRIAEAGGLILCQDSDSAKFDGMPESAVATGLVNRILKPEEMMPVILDYISRAPTTECEHDDPDQASFDPVSRDMERLFELIRAEYGINFQHYKPTTVLRRIDRRLEMAGVELDRYVEILRRDLEELGNLYRDLLIGVTKFFRDPEAFEALASPEIMDSLFRSAEREGELRVWCAGCATGEEPYTLAIALEEERRKRNSTIEIKIFATDVHRQSLDYAGRGVYVEDALLEVNEDLKNRYFKDLGNGTWKVTSEIRQSVIFAYHNVIKSAPFTRMDLVTCRNLLIYFRPVAQKKAVSLFHFGLRTGGVLFLGPSETPGDLLDEFESIDTHWKIYRKRRDVRLPTETRTLLPPIIHNTGESDRWAGAMGDSELIKVYDDLLNRFAPAGLLVDDRFHLLHTFGDADQFLRVNRGRPSTNVLDLLDPDLRTPISGALQHAARKGTTVTYTSIPVGKGDEESRFDLTISVLGEEGRTANFYFLAFHTGKAPAVSDKAISLPENEKVDLSALTREHISNIEQELQYTKENLQATIEELETSNEELQATNEELVASNEELQSSNEELHSVNEELHTVNAEHQRKITELSEMTNDLENLLTSTEVGVIFLDRNLAIRKFTPKVRDFFDLLPQDEGRSIESFSHSLMSKRLFSEARLTLEDGNTRERQIRDRQGRVFFKRILPYRVKNEIRGVLLTFVDITEVSSLQLQRDRLATVLEKSPDFVGMVDENLTCTYVNPAGLEMTGYESDFDVEGKPLSFWHTPDRLTKLAENLRELSPGDAISMENFIRHADGTEIPVNQVVIAHPGDEGGESIGYYSTVARDIRDLHAKEESLRILIRTLETIVRELPGVVLVYDADRKLEYASNAGRDIISHLKKSEASGRFPDEVEDCIDKTLKTGKYVKCKLRSFPMTIGKEKLFFQPRVTPVTFDDGEHPLGAMVVLEDVTTWQELDAEKSDLLGAASHELKNPLAAIQLPLLLMLEGRMDESPRKYRGLLRNMSEEVDRMRRTVNGLLDLTRFEMEDSSCRREVVQLSEFLESVFEAVEATAVHNDVELILTDDTDDPVIYVDIERLRTALVNILHNAIKYSPQNGTVELYASFVEKNNRKLRFEVSDEGDGIPKEARERIFERFYRIKNTGKSGSGLGLSIARSFVEAHGGTIRVTSKKGDTRFFVDLPNYRVPKRQTSKKWTKRDD